MITRIVALLPLLLVGNLIAQNRVTGELKCAKSADVKTVDIGDAPDHKLSLSQRTCGWAQPLTIQEMRSSPDAHDTLSVVSEIRGHTSEDRGYQTVSMVNGDRVEVRFTGSSSVNKGTGQGLWRIAGGEGKFRGITGSGSFSSSQAADGTLSIQFNGSYSLAAAVSR